MVTLEQKYRWAVEGLLEILLRGREDEDPRSIHRMYSRATSTLMALGEWEMGPAWDERAKQIVAGGYDSAPKPSWCPTCERAVLLSGKQ